MERMLVNSTPATTKGIKYHASLQDAGVSSAACRRVGVSAFGRVLLLEFGAISQLLAARIEAQEESLSYSSCEKPRR